MNHEEFKSHLKRAMGDKIPQSARDTWAPFVRHQLTVFFVNYDWIKRPAFLKWIHDCPSVDFGENQDGVSVWICRFGEVGHDK